MEFQHDNVRQVVEEDRLSNLPDDLIHKIMSCFDMKFAVQTCLLSSRWKLLWTLMPSLNFSSEHFGSSPEFAKFVTEVLSHRNHEAEVFSIELNFEGDIDNHEVLLEIIASYAFSHNVQQLNVINWPKIQQKGLLRFLLSSHSLKHLTLNGSFCSHPPITCWNFPNLATLHLNHFTFYDYVKAKSRKSIPTDLFSKCVNLRNLTLKNFQAAAVDIITPRLSNLILIDGVCSKVINVIAPQLENLTIIDCAIRYLNAPPGLSSLYYRGHLAQRFCNNPFLSLNKVSICLYLRGLIDKRKDARKTFKMLKKLHSVRYLTLNMDIVECISSFPDLVSRYLLPFSNLVCLTVIDSSMREDAAYKVKMYNEARNFLLANSPSATFITELPKLLLSD